MIVWQTTPLQSPRIYQYAQWEGICLSVKLIKLNRTKKLYQVRVAGCDCGVVDGVVQAKRVAEMYARNHIEAHKPKPGEIDETTDWTPR